MKSSRTLLIGLSFFLAFASVAFVFPVYTLPANPSAQAVLVMVFALVLGLFAERGIPSREPLPAILALLASCALLLVFPSHGKPALLSIAAGSLLLLIPGMVAMRMAQALRLVGLGSLAGFVSIKFSIYLHAIIQRDFLTGWFAQKFAGLLDLDAAILGNELVLRLPDESLSYSLGPEWTGLYYRVLALVMLVGLSVWRTPRITTLVPTLLLRLPLFWILAALWSGLVFIVQSQLTAMVYNFEIPWSPLYQLLIAVPPVLLASWLVVDCGERSEVIRGGQTLPRIFAGLAALCLMLACFFQFPGSEKPGRVLVDDGHSDWEWVGDPMNTRQFGTRTTYNYHGLGSLLKRHYNTTINFAELTPALLDTVDVLVLKTPTRAYSPTEVQAVLDYVHAGGGLYTISDHTDVFGMSTFLNEITQHFGFTYNKDTVFDLLSTNDQFWQQQDVIPHPAVQHLPWYRYLTGCSIKPGWTSGLATVGAQCGSDLLSYATSNFFDVYYPRTELRAGNLVQLVSAHFGRGRIIGFSDSTTYSNFAMFLPGRFEHLMSIIQYVNRRSSLVSAFWVFVFLAVGFAMLSWKQGGLPQHEWPVWLLVAGAVAVPAVRQINATVYELPERRRIMEGIALDEQLSHFIVPRKNKIEDNDPLNMETFYVWLYRSGLIPELVSQQLHTGTRQYIIVNPDRAPDREFRQDLRSFVEKGGRLLVSARPGEVGAGVNDWLQEFGLGFDGKAPGNSTVFGKTQSVPVFVESALIVHGGEAFYWLEDGTPLAVETQVGKGRVLVSGLADCFNNAHLGRYDSIPSELSYEYLQMYYQHTGMVGGEIEAELERPGL